MTRDTFYHSGGPLEKGGLREPPGYYFRTVEDGCEGPYTTANDASEARREWFKKKAEGC